MQSTPENLGPVRARVSNACDNCKLRKVKCDGQLPCSYCTRRQRGHACRFSPPIGRRLNGHGRRPSPPSSLSKSASSAPPEVTTPPNTRAAAAGTSASFTHRSDASAEEEAEVPREARLVSDAQGKLIFIGDCAPLSLFQTVRQIVTTRVDPDAFAPQTSRVSMLENVSSLVTSSNWREPDVNASRIGRLVSTFVSVTSALVDFFDNARLASDIAAWHTRIPQLSDVTSAVNYLVLAIGSQSDDEESAAGYFLHGKRLALSSLDGNLSVETIEAFILVTVYMLRACQINGSFLFFGIAVRAAYSVGLHRTEVNCRFGAEVHAQRDRLWKSLRVLDLFLSISMGRPPASSDGDCTVPYHVAESDGSEKFDLLNASVQILLIAEGIVIELYSRRKVSLQLTEGISHQLRQWSNKWLSSLRRVILEPSGDCRTEVAGACQVLSSYYYAVMLVSRPFLMYELCKRLPESATGSHSPIQNGDGSSGRSRVANACIDAACVMVEMVHDLVKRGLLDGRMPLIVSWLFASSLVIGVGLIGGFGRSILDKYTRMSIAALHYFAKNDAHALQYSLIAESLLSIALEYLDAKETEERRRITEHSSQLFGLMPERQTARDGPTPTTAADFGSSLHGPRENATSSAEPDHSWMYTPFGDLDPAVFSLSGSIISHSDSSLPNQDPHSEADQLFGALNLFPLLDGNGHIDLAHYLS
ncbi:Uu.00g119910.m01.CDS01 [Anthostomella pinea]|uniref:Uu.00g119910.m01.CDS01 n=1 Tax=Anthostomella pinea TaxID=933095 RepID=A0AAI8VBG5_9PEZI|nr:Uu.00g119910.m01.CDS01 [Anthostomella pinea]